MLKNILFAVSCAFMAVTWTVPAVAQDTVMFNYQGRVKMNDTDFDGSGNFKFAILSPDKTSTLWSNDSTSIDGTEPTTGITVPVTDGVFNVLMGENGTMDPINSTIFQNKRPLKLRTWFKGGAHDFEMLRPDHNLINVTLITSQTGNDDFTIYVNGKTGDDSNSGLQPEQAKKTIQAAVDIVPPRVMANLTIDIADGTYPEEVTLFGISVKPGKNLTLQGDQDPMPALDPNPTVIISGSDGDTTHSRNSALTAVQTSGITLVGICFENAKLNGILLENGKYAIKNCVSRNNLGAGLALTSQAFAELDGLVATNNGAYGVSLNTQSRVFLNSCTCSNNSNSGLFLVDSSTANLKTSGDFSNNGQAGITIIGCSQLGFDNNFHGTANNNSNYGIVAGWNSYAHNVNGHLMTNSNSPLNTYEFKGGHGDW